MVDYVTSDLHLGHEAIIRHCNRPFRTLRKMNKTLIKNIKETVGPEDRLFILGDLFWPGHDQKDILKGYMDEIPCRKILILGNHDRLAPWQYIDCGIESVHTSLIYDEGILMVHDPAISQAVPENWIVLCGHIHNLFDRVKNVINVGVDVRGFKPVDVQDLLAQCWREGRGLV